MNGANFAARSCQIDRSTGITFATPESRADDAEASKQAGAQSLPAALHPSRNPYDEGVILGMQDNRDALSGV
jgi:hypothetical protein